MNKKMLFNVYVERKCIRHGKQLNASCSKSHKSNHFSLSKDDGSWLKIHRRAVRVHSKLRLYLSNIEPRPFWFLTLTLPPRPWVMDLKNTTPKKVQTLLNQLHRAFKYKFPKGYLIWVIEYSHKKGIHVHYACKTKLKISKGYLKSWFSKKWEYICGSDEKTAVHIIRFDHDNFDGIHENYLTMRSKLKQRTLLINAFKQQRTFGVVGKKNIKFYPTKKYVLTGDELDKLRKILIKQLKNRQKMIKNSKLLSVQEQDERISKLGKQINKIASNFSRHYLDYDMRDFILRQIEKLKQNS